MVIMLNPRLSTVTDSTSWVTSLNECPKWNTTNEVDYYDDVDRRPGNGVYYEPIEENNDGFDRRELVGL